MDGGGGVFLASFEDVVDVCPRVFLIAGDGTFSSSSSSSSVSSFSSSSSSSSSSSLTAPRVFGFVFDLLGCCEAGRFRFLFAFAFADNERDGGIDRFREVIDGETIFERDDVDLEFYNFILS